MHSSLRRGRRGNTTKGTRRKSSLWDLDLSFFPPSVKRISRHYEKKKTLPLRVENLSQENFSLEVDEKKWGKACAKNCSWSEKKALRRSWGRRNSLRKGEKTNLQEEKEKREPSFPFFPLGKGNMFRKKKGEEDF